MRRVWSLAICLRGGIVGALLSALALIVATGDALAQQQRRLNVVATVSMLADAARAVGGERAEVASLLGEGVDPHTYRPTRSDIAKLSAADLVIANGHNLEAQLEQPLRALGRTKPVIFVAERVPADRLIADPNYPGRADPHVWMEPQLWVFVVEAVRDALIERDPAGREAYQAGAKAYAEELLRLDVYARKILRTVPEQSRVLITAHDAFNYFGRAYGFEVEGIQGLSTESEAGLQRIEELVRLVVARRIKAAFFESSVPDRNIRALVEGAAAQGHALAVGGQLYSDALGAPGTYEGTLIGMLDHNVTTIARALGGEAPARGMAGKLRAGG
ncbi:MAG TPA: zinc ABC transporter substrate-binding protein [Xanthobacteraceae bacterium]|nr:zinc ABC transporter substrate-binding protein [Xanthobacteraceae bacterium]